MIGILFRKIYSFCSDLYYHRLCRFYKKGIQGSVDVLLQIIKAAEQTEYGQRHRFNRVVDATSYAKEVPLCSYTDLAPYIKKQESGVRQVLTADEPVYFAKSSGTTGSQKIIPMTKKSLRGINMTMMFLHQGAQNRLLPPTCFPGRSLMMLNMASMDSDEQSGAATSGGMAKMKSVVPLFWVTPAEALHIQDERVLSYLHALFALHEPKLETISAPFASALLRLFKTMEDHWASLIDDIAFGKINPDIIPDDSLRSMLTAKLSPNPSRAMVLQHLGKNGVVGMVPKIWKKLYCINTVISGDFAAYEAPLRAYIGKDIPIFSSMYGASEGQIGIGTTLNAPTYLLCTHLTYFEFIPEDEIFADNPSVLPMTEVLPGRRYELVITTPSGFYRYRLGDVVQIVDFYYDVPIIHYCYRIGMLQNITGEKTTTDAMMQALHVASQQYGLHFSDFTTVANLAATVPYYTFLVEAEDRPPADFSFTLDKQLGEANPRYRAAREAGKLSSCRVVPTAPACFSAFRDLRLQDGTSTNQFKMPRRLTMAEALTCFHLSEEIE